MQRYICKPFNFQTVIPGHPLCLFIWRRFTKNCSTVWKIFFGVENKITNVTMQRNIYKPFNFQTVIPGHPLFTLIRKYLKCKACINKAIMFLLSSLYIRRKH